MDIKTLGSDFMEPYNITDEFITIKKSDYFSMIKLIRTLMGPLQDPLTIDNIQIMQPRAVRLDFGDSKCSSCGQ